MLIFFQHFAIKSFRGYNFKGNKNKTVESMCLRKEKSSPHFEFVRILIQDFSVTCKLKVLKYIFMSLYSYYLIVLEC